MSKIEMSSTAIVEFDSRARLSVLIALSAEAGAENEEP